MLGEGVRAALELLGIEHRTVCYVEREAPAAAQLVRLMEAGAIDPAPVWSDLLTFDGAAWRGCVDFLVAGFPCQDISIAGRRAGLDGQRSGLFFDILDIADDCGAHGLFLENVSAIATATATAVDEAEGTLEERAAARVVGELADRGWDAEWITLSASDVGASHGRARWFCFAWRRDVDDARRVQRGARHEQDRPGRSAQSRHEAHHGPANGGGLLDDAQRFELPWQRIHARPGPAGPGAPDADGAGAAVANAGKPRLPHAEQHEPCGSWAWHEWRAAPELRGAPLFAPGPADHRWGNIVSAAPWLAPAIADPSGDGSKRRLNPRFAEWLMGWPIGWTENLNAKNTITCPGDQPGSHSQAGTTCGICQWRELLQVRLQELVAAPSRGLQQADGSDVSVCGMSSRRTRAPASELRDLRISIPTEEDKALDAVRQPGMLEPDGALECAKALENRAHRLRQVGNGVVPIQAAAALVELVRRTGG